MKSAKLYITVNLVNGRKYIGQTTTLCKSYLGSGRLISAAIKKHGRESFVRIDLYEDEWEFIDLLEHEYIAHCNAVESNEYYNLKDGGHTGGHTTEAREKMRIARTGKKASEETKQKMSKANTGCNNPFYGLKHDEAALAKIKVARAKQVITPEHAESISKALKGIKKTYKQVITPERAATISKSLKGKPKMLGECPYCGKICSINHLKRWHFDNCKERNAQ